MSEPWVSRRGAPSLLTTRGYDQANGQDLVGDDIGNSSRMRGEVLGVAAMPLNQFFCAVFFAPQVVCAVGTVRKRFSAALAIAPRRLIFDEMLRLRKKTLNNISARQ